MSLVDIGTSFVLGLLTPLTAVCVLPMYPGFIAYLANRFPSGTSKSNLALVGSLITLGIITFMMVLGLVFTTILETSLTTVVSIVSPIAFGLLLVIGLLLVFNVDFARFFPSVVSPKTDSPHLSAYLYGLFFGAIVLPCNPAFIAVFFTKTLLAGSGNFLLSMLNVFMFGLGMGFPLMVLSLLSASVSKPLIHFLTSHKRAINVTTGAFLVAIASYYLHFVFKVLG